MLPRLVPILQWASSRLLLCFAVFEQAAHPAADAPLPANNWTYLLLGAILLALPLSLCLPIGMITGWRYMRRIGMARRRWLAAWWTAAGAAVVVEAWLIRTAVLEWGDFPRAPGLPGRGDLGPLELLVAFAVATAAMITVLTIASGVRRPEPAGLAR